MKIKKAWILGAIGIVLIAVFAGIVFTISCIPTGGDHERVNLLLRDVEEHYKFTTMREDGNGPAVYCVGLSYSDHISIYGEYSEQKVARILEVISAAQARRTDKKPIKIRFCTKELDENTLYREVTIDR